MPTKVSFYFSHSFKKIFLKNTILLNMQKNIYELFNDIF